MVLVRETCEYHSRGEEYGVILERPVGTTADWRGIVLVPVSTANRSFIKSNNITILHCASQEHCHVCLGSDLTKPCLPCVVTSETAAIHVMCQHSMCNFLSCKILQGPHPTALTRKAFLLDKFFLILSGVYKKLYTFYHAPSHAPSNQNQCTTRLHAMHLSTT